MPQLALQFLGVPEIRIDGEPIQLARRHSWAVLAYLALTRRAHARDELATLLASESADDTARKLLRNVLTDLVSAGLGDYLRTSRQSVAFDPAPPHTIDLDRLEALLEPRAVITPEDVAWAAEHCDSELLAGLALRDAPLFELWLTSEREHRRQQLSALGQRLLEQLYWSGQLDAGIALARRLLAVDPWQEETHRQLMRLLARDGQLAAALAQYERCRELLASELDVEPQPATTALAERLRAGPVAPRHNLPRLTAGDDLFGRDTEIDAVVRSVVDPGCRLLTIAGVGGIGKTQLALAAAARIAAPAPLTEDHPFADGVFFISQAEIGGAASEQANEDHERSLLVALAFALGIVFYGRIDRREQLLAYLGTKRILLVLDGLERVLDAIPVLEAMLQRTPGVTLLVTSRVPLGIAGEWTQDLTMLARPAAPDEVERAPASQFFLREARRMNVSVGLPQYVHVVEVRRLTGGLPLAIKLAAGWLGVLTCAEIASELRHGSQLLGAPVPSSVSDPHPASVRSVMDAAVDSLSAPERQALARLAVFSGSFTRPAAEAAGVALTTLLVLCRRALVERTGDERYALHPLVHQHATELLAGDPAEEQAARAAHAGWYAAFVAEHGATLFQQPGTHQTLAGEFANLRAAWEWAVDAQDFETFRRLWGGMAIWHRMAGLHREWSASVSQAVNWLRADCADPARCAVVVRLLVASADALLWQGLSDHALPLIDDARACAGTIDSLALEALVSLCEGRVLHFRGQSEVAIETLRRAQVLAEATRQPAVEAESLLALSMLASDLGGLSEADAYLRRAGPLFERIGDRLTQSRLLLHRGRLAVTRGDFTRATLDLEQSEQLSRGYGDRSTEGWAVALLAAVDDSAHGRHREADARLERAGAIARQTGDRFFEAFVLSMAGRNALHAGDLVRAEKSFELVIERNREIGHQLPVSFGLLALGQLAFIRGDASLAEDRARQSLRVLEDIGRPLMRAPGLVLLGRTREQLGLLADANDAFAQAFAIADEQGMRPLRGDALTGLASCALAAGNLGLALHHVEQLLPDLHEHQFAGCEEPGWTIWTCDRVLRAVGDPRAEDIVRQGATLFERRMTALAPPAREHYITAYAERRAVVQRWLVEIAPGDASTRALLALAAGGPDGASR